MIAQVALFATGIPTLTGLFVWAARTSLREGREHPTTRSPR
jgi:hypothetical protein